MKKDCAKKAFIIKKGRPALRAVLDMYLFLCIMPESVSVPQPVYLSEPVPQRDPCQEW
jgi:hypothetical protein